MNLMVRMTLKTIKSLGCNDIGCSLIYVRIALYDRMVVTNMTIMAVMTIMQLMYVTALMATMAVIPI